MKGRTTARGGWVKALRAGLVLALLAGVVLAVRRRRRRGSQPVASPMGGYTSSPKVRAVGPTRRLRAASAAMAMLLAGAFLVVRPESSSAAEFVVRDAGDSGPSTLRQAIIDANANPGADTIVFRIDPLQTTVQGTEPRATIVIQNPLPPITGPVIIDGTQPGFESSDRPLVEITGTIESDESGQEFREDGLVFAPGSAPSTVRRLSLTQFDSAIVLQSTATVVESNWIGLDLVEGPSGNITGVEVTGNGNTVGRRNVITYNHENGVLITGTSNLVLGNNIGLDPAGVFGTGRGTGVNLAGAAGTQVGGTALEDRNVISSNFEGVRGTSATGTVILGNYIGTDASGMSGAGNWSGIALDNSPATIGGVTPGSRNVISANIGFDTGIAILDSSGTVI